MPDNRSTYQTMPTMHRRAFLGALVAIGAAAALPLAGGVEEDSFAWFTFQHLESGCLSYEWAPARTHFLGQRGNWPHPGKAVCVAIDGTAGKSRIVSEARFSS